MATTLEIKYFSTFWLKKIKAVVEANTTSGPVPPTAPFFDVPRLYTSGATTDDWYIEEARIRGGYNNLSVDLGVKAYLVEENITQQNRFNSMIYSGIFNSRTGVNDTNQFSVGGDITKSADPANGSIQKLYAEDTNLIIFQEKKVSRALIDKNAIYSAEGSPLVTSTQVIIGQIIAYAGEYGISQDPFSFAVYGYRKYFTDRNKGCVLRLSRDGITEISSYGMHDFFRDELSSIGESGIVRGSWDIHTKNYVLSLQSASNYKTLSFDESVLGWTSFLSFKPSFMISVGASFYSFNPDPVSYTGTSAVVSYSGGNTFKHYLFNNIINFTNKCGIFYFTTNDSDVTVVLNSKPSLVKNFKTLNYEGDLGWEMVSMLGSSSYQYEVGTDSTALGQDVAVPIGPYTQANSLQALTNDLFSNNFKSKENKFFCNLLQEPTLVGGVVNVIPQYGEVIWGNESSGIKGFFATVKMKLNNSTIVTGTGGDGMGIRSLFSVSTNYVESSY
tara:strand:+ start:695 stop:2197 length:1503 start_codon:yes stop_codon:yes gene_type:complete